MATIPEVREMVQSAKQFVAGELHFSYLVGPIERCEFWSRVNGVNSPINALAKRWSLLVDRTWNEYGQHIDRLSVSQLRDEIERDLDLHEQAHGSK